MTPGRWASSAQTALTSAGDEAFLRGDDVGQHGQAAHDGHRPQAAGDDLAQQRHRLHAPIMKIRVRIELAKARSVRSCRAWPRSCCRAGRRRRRWAWRGQPVRAPPRTGRPRCLRRRRRRRRRAAPAAHAVHRQRGAQAVEDAAFHLGVGLGLDGAGRRGAADVGATSSAPACRAPSMKPPTRWLDLSKACRIWSWPLYCSKARSGSGRRFGGVGVGLVDQAGDGQSSGVAGVLAMLRALQRLTFLGSKLSAIRALTSSAPAIT